MVLIVAAGFGFYAHHVASRQLALAISVAAWSVVLALAARLSVALFVAIDAGLANRSITREQVAQQREFTRKMRAEADLAEREARVLVVTGKYDEQVFIRDTGHGQWRAAHLDPRRYANGLPDDPTPLEVALWGHFQRQRGLPPGPGQPLALPAGPAYELPAMVRWADLLPAGRGDLSRLVLGVHLNSQGRLEPLTISLYELFHTIAAAATGWGKSAFAGAILAQLATCPEPVELVLIDQQDHGLAPFKSCDRLRYPLLREPGEILSALHEVYHEATLRRSALFARYDADDLAEYNSRAGEFLPPVVVVVEEAASLLANKELGLQLKRHAWELRKFGVYQILLLTSAKGTVIDTEHRQQFASKVQLHAGDKNQARLLIDAPEAVSFPPGRALVDLPGRAPTLIQTPYLDRREIRGLFRPAGALPPGPAPWQPPPDLPTDKQQATLDLWDGGERDAGVIARAVYGPGGRQEALVRATLEKFNRV